MNLTKKLFTLMLIGVLVVVSFVPSTFSWYTHNKSETGQSMRYNENIELSMKTAANTVTMSTVTCDANGEVTNTNAVTGISVGTAQANAPQVVYYKTTLENSGGDDVMVDMETSNLPNNADFAIGTVSPTLNEKAFASRAVRTKVSDDKVRVYFKTYNGFNPYWTHYTGDSATVTFNSSMTNDFNIAYKVSGSSTEQYAKLSRCANTGSSGNNTNVTDATVFFFDLPTNTEHFYFFNHWYFASSSNKEWNRTIDITDLTAGKLYYLTGASVDGKWKEYKTLAVDHTLIAVNNYYKTVRMSTGASVFADIGLKKDSTSDDDEEFIPDYFGTGISYSVASGTNVVSVNSDGLVTPKASGTATVRTTITGRYGDTRVLETTINIPSSIDQVPIIKNVRIPAGEEVDVYWYARNNSTTAAMTTNALFITI